MTRMLRVAGLAAAALAYAAVVGAHPTTHATAHSIPQFSKSSAASTAVARARISIADSLPPTGAPAILNRVVCDNQRVIDRQYWCELTDIRGSYASTTGRVEGEPADSSLDQQIHQVYNLLGVTYDFYLSNFNYDLTDHIGLGVANDPNYQRVLSATVNTCDGAIGGIARICNGDNAFWMAAPEPTFEDPRILVGGSISIGAGLAGISDVIAHELQHGVTDERANLQYQGQSGALNESISDVFGELVDRAKQLRDYGKYIDDWTIGEGHTWTGITTSALSYLRSLRDPYARPVQKPTRLRGQDTSCKGWQPDRMSSPCWDTDPRNEDYGGVHTNSGVGNKLAYLISNGDSFNGRTITGIGDAATAQLWWATLPTLSATANYFDFANAMAAVCPSLESRGAIPARACSSTVLPALAATEMSLRRVTFSSINSSLRSGSVIRPTVKIMDSLRTKVSKPMVGQLAYLQVRNGGAWVSVAQAYSDFRGIATFNYSVRTAGVYRLYVPATSAAPELSSALVTIRLR